MAQFTYVCRSQDTHVICIDGENFTYKEYDASSYAKQHGRYISIDGINVYQTLYFKLQSEAVHLAQVVRAIEISRFIWQHTNRLMLTPEAKQ